MVRQCDGLDLVSLFIKCIRLLYDMHSPRSNSGRGMAFGRIYSRDGTLIATTAQEGLIRLSKREQEKIKDLIPGNGNTSKL